MTPTVLFSSFSMKNSVSLPVVLSCSDNLLMLYLLPATRSSLPILTGVGGSTREALQSSAHQAAFKSRGWFSENKRKVRVLDTWQGLRLWLILQYSALLISGAAWETEQWEIFISSSSALSWQKRPRFSNWLWCLAGVSAPSIKPPGLCTAKFVQCGTEATHPLHDPCAQNLSYTIKRKLTSNIIAARIKGQSFYSLCHPM